MFKEIKYLIYIFIIFLFLFLTGRYYFSDSHKKKSYRSLSNINQKINLYSQKLTILEDDSSNIIEYVKNTESTKKKKYHFWELIDKNE